MEHAPIYYGFYQPLVTGKALETEESQNYEHNRFPAEYLLTFMIVYLVILLLLVARSFTDVQSAANKKRLASLEVVYTDRVFCGWDFSITEGKAASLRKIAILGLLVEDVEADEKKH